VTKVRIKRRKSFLSAVCLAMAMKNTISGPVAGKNVTVTGKWIYGS
jgi:hypothetical protein